MILAPSQTVSRMKLCDLSKPVLPASESSGQVREDFDPLSMQQRNAPRWETSVELRRHGQPNRVDGIKTSISQTKPTQGRLASLLASSSFLLHLLLLLQAVTKVKLKFFLCCWHVHQQTHALSQNSSVTKVVLLLWHESKIENMGGEGTKLL